MIKKLRIKIILIVLCTSLLLLTIVLSLVFSATMESSLSDSYGSMIWVLDDIRNGIYYGIPLGAPRPMAILFVNPDGTLDENDSAFYRDNREMRLLMEIGSIEDVIAVLQQHDGSPDIYTAGDRHYLSRHEVINDGRTVYVLVDVSRNITVLETFRRNAVVDSSVAMVIMLFLAVVFSGWITRPIARAKESQQEFFAAVSHDLRTPLTIILANSGILEEFSGIDPVLTQCHNNIRVEAEHMRQMTSNMLDHLSFEDIIANKNMVVMESVNMEPLVMKSIRSFEPFYNEHGRKIQHDIAKDLWVRGNELDLDRVVGILLDNALKYSDEASEICIRLWPENSRAVHLDVRSESEPMDRKTRAKIFQPFYRADTSRNDRNSYGLGLSTAKNIIKFHGGKIRAASGKHDNVFHVTLPQITPHISHPDAVRHPSQEGN